MLVYNFEQRTPEWYDVRKGKITASPILNILGSIGTAKCQTAIDNLAIKLAVETVHGIMENDFVSFDMQRGIELEPYAFEKIKSILGLSFIEVEKIGFIEKDEHIGCSPDGYVIDRAVIEIKCPNEENFFKLCLKDEIDPKHIAQMQHQMYCSNTDLAYYFAYCIHNSKEYYYMREVKRNDDTIKLIQERCEMVTEKKLDYITKLNNLNQ